MKLFDFFKKPLSGIFIDRGDVQNAQTAFDNVKTDYILSRSLYSSAPSEAGSYADYSLGNYSTKTYIDTFSWFIGLPEITAGSDAFTADI